jgi:hypothetical protein
MTFCGGPLTDETVASLVDDVYLPLLHGLAGLQQDAGTA